MQVAGRRQHNAPRETVSPQPRIDQILSLSTAYHRHVADFDKVGEVSQAVGLRVSMPEGRTVGVGEQPLAKEALKVVARAGDHDVDLPRQVLGRESRALPGPHPHPPPGVDSADPVISVGPPPHRAVSARARLGARLHGKIGFAAPLRHRAVVDCDR